jgi:hypothetical protein
MIRKSICYRGSLVPENVVAEVHMPTYAETWGEGLTVYHNPHAKHPLPPGAIPGAGHHTSRGGRIMSTLPGFHPVGSITIILDPK